MHPHTVRVFQSKFRVSPVTCCLPPRPLSAGVVALATGVHHTCALLMGGGAVCWGDNEHGQLGTGDTTNKLTPTAVAGLETGEGRIDIAVRCVWGQTGLLECLLPPIPYLVFVPARQVGQDGRKGGLIEGGSGSSLGVIQWGSEVCVCTTVAGMFIGPKLSQSDYIKWTHWAGRLGFASYVGERRDP